MTINSSWHDGAGGNTIIYNATENTMRVISMPLDQQFPAEWKSNCGNFTNASELTNSDGKWSEFTINNVSSNFIEINTTGLDFPDDNFSLAETDLFVLSDESTDVEAFFEGANNVYEGADVNFNSQRIVLRETGSEGKHHYTNTNISSLNKIDTINGPVPTGLADGVHTITAANVTNTTGSGGEASVEITAGGSAKQLFWAAEAM